MRPLRFWLPLNGIEQEIIVPGEYVESIILRSAAHEAGHIIVAYHLGARVLGIAVGFKPELAQHVMFVEALYGWTTPSLETECIVKAAGPAADNLFGNGYTEIDASVDLRDIGDLTGQSSLDPYLSVAQDILAKHESEVGCIVSAFRRSLEIEKERIFEILPNGDIGAFLLDEGQLLNCLASNPAIHKS